MGQYYRAVTLGPRFGVKNVFSSWEYANGAKLMEHSYVGNNFVNAVLHEIFYQRRRIAWMGDYSCDDFNERSYAKKLSEEKFRDIYDVVWQKKADKTGICTLPTTDLILLNHTRQSFVDLRKVTKADDWGFIVHPLPLLTACGNGLGGGDYASCYPDADKVGLWAFDEIECVEADTNSALPREYVEERYNFIEK